jgi:hypothetical protein
MDTCLAPFMSTIISRSQSTFINIRSIHDNYMYVCNYARRLHKARTLALLLKLDIKKAFDSVRWDYLVNLLQWLGFPPKFRNWLVSLLRTSSSRVLLNGVLGFPILYGQGLRQGSRSRRYCLSLQLTLFKLSLLKQQRVETCTALGDMPLPCEPLYMPMVRSFIWPLSKRILTCSPASFTISEKLLILSQMFKTVWCLLFDVPGLILRPPFLGSRYALQLPNMLFGPSAFGPPPNEWRFPIHC